ncbi:MAG: hypothetical protein ACR2P2_16150 [Nakamurella sp.]
MRQTGQILGLAVAFGWMGMVLAISFLETPLKFRAPGITIPLGLGIGRIVFRALNIVEAGLAGVLIVALATSGAGPARWVLLAVAATVLALQLTFLRPRLDSRARQIIAGGQPPRSRLHLVYVALELGKVAALCWLGILVAATH